MLELVIAVGIGSLLLLTQCAKGKKEGPKSKSGSMLVNQDISTKPNGMMSKEKRGVEVQNSAKTKSKMTGNPKSNKDPVNEGGAVDGQGEQEEAPGAETKKSNKTKTKTNSKESKQSKKKNKTKEATKEGPSSNMPAKTMDGTQAAPTEAQATVNKEEKKEPQRTIRADDCGKMENTVYDMETPCANIRALNHHLIENAKDVQYAGNLDDNIEGQKKINAKIVEEIQNTPQPNAKNLTNLHKKLVEEKKSPYAPRKIEPSPSEKLTPEEKQFKVHFNNKKSVLYETKEQMTEEDEPKEDVIEEKKV